MFPRPSVLALFSGPRYPGQAFHHLPDSKPSPFGFSSFCSLGSCVLCKAFQGGMDSSPGSLSLPAQASRTLGRLLVSGKCCSGLYCEPHKASWSSQKAIGELNSQADPLWQMTNLCVSSEVNIGCGFHLMSKTEMKQQRHILEFYSAITRAASLPHHITIFQYTNTWFMSKCPPCPQSLMCP